MGERPVRLQLSRRKGFNLQALSLATNGLPAVKVDRTTVFGNPFRSHPDLPRSYAFESQMFRDWMVEVLGANLMLTKKRREFWDFKKDMASAGTDALRHRGAMLNTSLRMLRGKNLACWCPLPKADEPDYCHAAVLLELANALPREAP